MPTEILLHLILHIDHEAIVIMSFVSTGMNIFITDHFPSVICSQFNLCHYGAYHNSTTIIEWAIGIGRFATNDITKIAIIQKYLDELDNIRDNKYLWCWHVCICNVAAANGHLEIIKWFHVNGGTIASTVLHTAALHRNVKIFIMSTDIDFNIKYYLRYGEDEPPPTAIKLINIPDIAAEHGHLEVVEWFQTMNPKLSIINLHHVVKNGHLKILQWACQNGYIVDYSLYLTAVKYLQVKILMWMIGFYS
jgi:hypothetical protein